MSAFPGKVVIDGIVDVGNEKVFALQFLQARNPDWARKPFYAKFDPQATWLDDLKPAFGEKKFFFETEEESHEEVHGETHEEPGQHVIRIMPRQDRLAAAAGA
jgi:hypothetical protein